MNTLDGELLMKISSKIFFFTFSLIMTINLFQVQMIQANAALCVEIKYPMSINRTWDDISLLYRNQYHTPEEVIAELFLLNETAPTIVNLSVLGKSVQGRDIHLITITNEQITTPKAGVFIVAGHHAREQISTEAALRFMIRLINSYGKDELLTNYVDTEEIYIIPTLNPDGLHYVVGNDTMEGDPWLRKNLGRIDDDNDGKFDEDPYNDVNEDGIVSGYDVFGKGLSDLHYIHTYYEGIDDDGDGLVNEDLIGGTDLNRNYGYRWNDSSLDTGTGSNTLSNTFPGFSPFSEPETQIVRDFVSNHSFSMAMSLHSGINTTYFPWASDRYWAQSDRYYNIYSDLKSLLPSYFFDDYLDSGFQPASTQGPSYTSAGEWGDWCYATQSIQVPMTFEIYHKAGSESYGPIEFENLTHRIYRFDTIKEYFAPIESKIDSLWNDILPAFDYWLETTPRLELSSFSVIGNNSAGEELTVKFKIKNTSPHVTTITQLRIFNQDLSLIDILQVFNTLNGGESFSNSFKFTLKDKLGTGEELIFYIGNPFVGYYPLIVNESTVKSSQASFNLIGFSIAIPVLVTLKRKKNQKS